MLNTARIQHLAATATDAELPPLSATQARATVSLLDADNPLWQECRQRAKALLAEHAPEDADNDTEIALVAGDLYALAARK